MKLQPRARTMLAWSLWLATFGCCAAGLVVELVGTRPLTAAGLAEGAASGLLWSLLIPWDVWIGQLLRAGRPLPLAAQLAAVAGEFGWAPPIALGITLPALPPTPL